MKDYELTQIWIPIVATSKKKDLPIGTYEYNFSFVLQSDTKMPSSVELTKLGSNVRYEVNVTLNKGKKSQHRAIKPFTFLETIDLNSLEYMVNAYCCLQSN